MKNKIQLYVFLTILGLFLTIFTSLHVWAQTSGIILSDDQGKTIYAKNQNQPLIPASTLKILTSLAVIRTLGPNFHFQTWAYYDKTTCDLYLKGFGDPLFVSEEITKFAHQISGHIFKQVSEGQISSAVIRNIIVDQTYFTPQITIPGAGSSTNPYDATNGSLCANFNTIFLKWDSRSRQYISAEKQTPFPDILAQQIAPGSKGTDRILLSYDLRQNYPGILMHYFLKTSGVNITGTVQKGIFAGSNKNCIVHTSSFSLADIVQKLLQFSNNFIANQLMLTMGARTSGPPATLEKGTAVLDKFAEETLGLRGVSIIEGSGLSRRNRITPAQMRDILIAFMPWYEFLRRDGNEFYKTGTLSDVRSRAGFIRGKDNRLYPFVIMLNQTSTGYDAIRRMLKEKVDLQ
ncbi:D-alanyl-D-alanine carboxypeptidase [Desulfobacter hydrogenophilus]|uniref:D-alanyl-D-alanine carboxypeptidase n=1 Tax=Desulfobacter hydrogenophilus TaxID=2291 RepID=A0A328FFX5_9BACT|nr:D-alanyl-D-alanine carboxypeptidase [Desulfobacter hydrogenophilus]NDY72011.1 D-alanyl-D-alanine carboxypeptidase [Desulfobacter hydrogenophilus]QBH15458.1 D-alanyl-D-alanine carboxypeptidase [Desulfobacter hydrogenophilus]RAM01933.1 D-alanyl-D-alanine carboxypeptidase [Desulfobacter hydrogenophilus]